jgi:hypothetical protein
MLEMDSKGNLTLSAAASIKITAPTVDIVG